MTSAGLFLVLALGQSPAPMAAVAPDLLVEASVSTAGPYGELWILRVLPKGDAILRV
jgi:hypothetical protein